MAIKPLSGYVLIEPVEDEQKSAGGVYLPETSKDKPSKGKVIDTSDGMWIDGKWHGSQVKKGDTVVYKKWVNQEVKDGGKEYLLVHLTEVMGIVL